MHGIIVIVGRVMGLPHIEIHIGTVVCVLGNEYWLSILFVEHRTHARWSLCPVHNRYFMLRVMPALDGHFVVIEVFEALSQLSRP